MTAQAQQAPINLTPIVAAGVIAAALAGGAYVYATTPSVSVQAAERACLQLAHEHVTSTSDIRATDGWTKGGKRIVELGLFRQKDAKSYTPRICVVDARGVMIVSGLENRMYDR
jgi:hypothetical protein